MNLEDDHFQKILINNLIGKSTKYHQDKLSFGLISNLERIKLIKVKSL